MNRHQECFTPENSPLSPCENNIGNDNMEALKSLRVGSTLFSNGNIIVCIFKDLFKSTYDSNKQNRNVNGFIGYNAVNDQTTAFLTFTSKGNTSGDQLLVDEVLREIRSHPLYTNRNKQYGQSRNQSVLEYYHELNHTIQNLLHEFYLTLIDVRDFQPLRKILKLSKELNEFKLSLMLHSYRINEEIKQNENINDLINISLLYDEIQRSLGEMAPLLRSYTEHFMEDRLSSINIMLADENSRLQHSRQQMPEIVTSEINLPLWMQDKLGKIEKIYLDVINLEGLKVDLWRG
jgi:hypothetical protein